MEKRSLFIALSTLGSFYDCTVNTNILLTAFAGHGYSRTKFCQWKQPKRVCFYFSSFHGQDTYLHKYHRVGSISWCSCGEMIYKEAEKFAYQNGAKVAVIYGGAPMG